MSWVVEMVSGGCDHSFDIHWRVSDSPWKVRVAKLGLYSDCYLPNHLVVYLVVGTGTSTVFH